MANEQLALRNQRNKKKPTFMRRDSPKVKRLKPTWRRPKGDSSNVRKRRRSYRKMPTIGYCSPKEVRGLTRDGHKVIMVHNVEMLESIIEPITISGNVGDRKRVTIIKKAQEKKLQILNIKDPDAYIKTVEENIKKKQQKAKAKKAKEAKKKAEAEKKKEKKPETAKELPPEEQIEKEKKAKEEKRKVLEHK